MNKAYFQPLLVACLTASVTTFAFGSPAKKSVPPPKSGASQLYQQPGIIKGYDPLTPEQRQQATLKTQADLALADALDAAGIALMDKKQYAGAEVDFQQVVTLDPKRGLAYSHLANAQRAQGKTADAMQTYRTLFYEVPNLNGSQDPKSKAYLRELLHDDPDSFEYGPGTTEAQMNYIILLAQTGQWPEAVNFFNHTLPSLAQGAVRFAVPFDPKVVAPERLEAAAHLAIGSEYDNMDLHDKALAEYALAAQVQPDWAIANYYYGHGLQQAKRTAEAKAAFTKAAALGNGDVKTAAETALR